MDGYVILKHIHFVLKAKWPKFGYCLSFIEEEAATILDLDEQKKRSSAIYEAGEGRLFYSNIM